VTEGYAASVTLDAGDPGIRGDTNLRTPIAKYRQLSPNETQVRSAPPTQWARTRLLGWNQYVSLASQSAPKSLRDAGDDDYRGDTNLRTPIAKYRPKLERGTHTIVFASTTPIMRTGHNGAY
jgi:hypothetical protein